jgi:WhiB family redox-sensing transcriptional regulator
VKEKSNFTEPVRNFLFPNRAIIDSEYYKEVRGLSSLNVQAGSEPVVEHQRDELSAEEADWLDRYNQLFEWVSASTAGRMLGMGHQWVTRNATHLGIDSTLVENETKHPIHGYRKEIILTLREVLVGIPSQGDWASVPDLETRTGMERKRLQGILFEVGIESELRIANHNRRVSQFYPPAAESLLNEFKSNLPPPSGDWKTDTAVAKILGKDLSWVHSRTSDPIDTENSEIRTSPNGYIGMYNSPELIARLKKEADAMESYPFATKQDVAVRAIAKLVKHRDAWVIARLPYTSSSLAIKRNPSNNRSYAYMTPNPKDDMIDMPQNILDLTFEEYAMHRENWLEVETRFIDERKRELELIGTSLKQRLSTKRSEQPTETKDKQNNTKSELGQKIPLWPVSIVIHDDHRELAWQTQALCTQTDPEIFSPEKGKTSKSAKKVCAKCEVQEQCLAYALEHNERFGIWGGLDVKERDKL